MSKIAVQRQNWQRWPRVLVVEKHNDDGTVDERRYVPESGKLTAEQVREAIEANSWAETSTIREFNDSSWQAIADELNDVSLKRDRAMEVNDG